jgi:hypothetical protein
MACDRTASTGDQFEQDNIRDSHVRCQHRFDLVFRPHPVNDRQSGIERSLVGTSRTKIEVQRVVRGKYYDKEGNPTFKVQSDGRVDWSTYSGFRRYHSDCHVCHGPDGEDEQTKAL